MVEYALLLGFVGLSVVGLATGVGLSVKGIWSGIASAFTAASAAS
jgi:Flp pilus assembly pilin Flp